jgi:hypothetical protein
VDDDLSHERCRLGEFRRWNRVMLEHEREHLSRVMDQQAAFLAEAEKRAILHEVTDIDYCLSLTSPRRRESWESSLLSSPGATTTGAAAPRL